VAYAAGADGSPLLCLSDLAEHSRNVAADPRASLLVTTAGAPGPETGASGTDPLALARVTLVGAVSEVGEADREDALERYRAAHPKAFYATFADFRFYRLQVASVRYVGGFGRMSWVDAAEYAAAEPDPLRAHAERVIEHMNDDHADALVAYCRAFGGRPDTVRATMATVDRYGFDILAADAEGGPEHAVRIVFGAFLDSPRVDTVEAVRKAMVDLLRRARAELGTPDPRAT
jgi:heme iron utilization protein